MLSINFVFFTVIEDLLIVFMIHKLLSLDIDWSKIVFISLTASLVTFVLHLAVIPPLLIIFGNFLAVILLIHWLKEASIYLSTIASSLGFIIYILTNSLILIILGNLNQKRVLSVLNAPLSPPTANYLILMLPQLFLILFAIYIINKKSFNLEKLKDYFQIHKIKLLSNDNSDIQKGRQVTGTIYKAVFLMALQGFFIVALNWNRRLYYVFKGEGLPSYNFPFLIDITVFVLSIVLLWLIYNLIQVFGMYKKEIVNWVKNKQLNELSWKKKMQRHDYNHHLGMLNMMLEMEKYEQAREYLNGVVGEVQRFEQLTLSSKDTLNALLYSKVKKACVRGLDLDIELITPLQDMEVKDWDLNRILGNLIDNAIEAAEKADSGGVKVQIDGREKYNIFKVQTFDVILPEKIKSNIFKKGYSSKKEEGHGLGLTIVKELVDYYQGEINVNVDSEEKITSFSVKLPTN
ncbi:MAG: sensor histidine kinase [Halanaerobiales bacterium]